MSTKTTKFNSDSIKDLPNNKPIVYDILDKNDKAIYIGSSKRGQGISRIEDHLLKGSHPVPGGKKVRIRQMRTIDEAQKTEALRIKRNQPRCNKKGK